MIQIDIDADLNMEDDLARNLAPRPADIARFSVGSVAIAGRPGFWSWVRVDEISDTAIFFHQIDEAEAAASGQLVVAATR